MTKEEIQPVIDEVGPYRPGQVIASDYDLDAMEQSVGGISTYDCQTGKTDQKEE
jgi:hypothetical protein